MITMQRLCDKCGKTENLPTRNGRARVPDPNTYGGWRMLSSGALEVMLCNECVRGVVTQIIDAKSRAQS